MPDDYDFSMSGFQFPRRAKNLFPSYGEQEESGFDPSGINKRAVGFAPFGSSYYPQQSIQQDNDYESDYTPSSTMKRYLDISQHTPKREDYQPSGWGRVLAAATGGLEGWKGGAARGVQAGMAVRDMPYARALTDYDTERESAASALKAEQQESQLKSMAGYRSGTLTEKARERERKAGYDEARTQTARDKEKGLNVRFGEEIKVKQADQAARDRHYTEMDRINDAYKKGLISESEKDRQLEGELGRERNRIMGISANASATAAGAAVTRAGAAVTAANAAATKAGKTNAPKPITPAAQVAAHKLAIDRAIEENPSWSKFKDKKGELRPESSFFGLGPTVDSAEYKRLKKRIADIEKDIHSKTPTGALVDDDDVEQTDF